MPVVLLIVGLVILAAVILVAAGRGGELSAERNDYAPLELGPVSATDVALLRPPAAAWGYNIQATDEALAQIAESIRERDVRIVALEQLVTDLSREPAPPPLPSPYAGARHPQRGAELARSAEAASPPDVTLAGQGAPGETAGETDTETEVTWSAQSAWAREAARPSEMPWPAPPTRPEQAVKDRDAAQPEAAPPQAQPGPPERSHD